MAIVLGTIANEFHLVFPMSDSQADRRARTLHVYNDRFALTVEPLDPDGYAATHRIALEMASALHDGSGRFNWKVGSKISVHLGPAELPDLYAVLNGWRSRVESTHRGADRNKGYRAFIDQGAVVFQLFVPKGRRTVRLSPADRFAVSTLVLDHIAASLRGQGPDTAYQQLRACYAESPGEPSSLPHEPSTPHGPPAK